MKRLDQLLDQSPAGFAKRYQALNALSTEEFRELLYKYKKLGIPYEFLAIPWLLESDRASYEFFLRQTPAGRARVAPEARRLKKVMKAAAPLFQFMKEKDYFFGSLSTEVQTRYTWMSLYPR